MCYYHFRWPEKAVILSVNPIAIGEVTGRLYCHSRRSLNEGADMKLNYKPDWTKNVYQMV